MFYVYILNSLRNPDGMYVGYTKDLKNGLQEHNSANVFTPLNISLGSFALISISITKKKLLHSKII